LVAPAPAPAADELGALRRELDELRRQNAALQEQLAAQRGWIDTLQRQVADLQGADRAQAEDLRALQAQAGNAAGEEPRDRGLFASPLQLGNVVLSGEAGLSFFDSQAEGQFANSEFRVDEAKLFLDAKVFEDVYCFIELNLTLRESPNEDVSLGEVYVDFENVSKLWGRERWLNVRVGRLDIPFGEEYRVRDAIDNPLVSHSLSDLWGVDEGIELYGELGRVRYVVAVQNGGHPALRDFNADKSVAGRVSYEPTAWLYTSLSAMRTGALHPVDDRFSELWFGNGFVRSLGKPETTSAFAAEVFEADVQGRWRTGHLKAAGGYLRYDDDDRAADNRRDVFYYYVEGVQQLNAKLYAAARVSQVFARDGFPLVGNGSFGRYQFRELTEELWRLSLGLGYRFSRHLVLKAEYSVNGGEDLGGGRRRGENFFALQAAAGF
jgi:FtsZ-binding cell division protein ZapB